MIPRAVLFFLISALSAAPARAAEPPAAVEPALPEADAPLPADILAPRDDPPAGPADFPVPAPLPRISSAAAAGASAAPRIPLKRGGDPRRTWGEGNPFVIWGGSPDARSRLFTAATNVRRTLLTALNQPETHRFPIVIQLREPSADSRRGATVSTSVAQLDDGFRIEINITPRRGSVPGELLRENFVRASLAEMILRGQENGNLDGIDAPPPDWLLHGALEFLDYRERGRLSESFATVFRLGRVLSVEEILHADPRGMDSVSATVYRVSCCGLLMTLLEQPRSGDAVTALLGNLAGSRDDAAAIIGAFPKLSSSANGLGKWWSLQLAKLSQPGVDELLTPAETETGLAAAVTLRFTPVSGETAKPGKIRRLFRRAGPDAAAAAAGEKTAEPPGEEQCDIREFARILPHPDRKAIFERSDLALTRLQLRAHPLYRPLINDYQEALRNLTDGKKTKDTAAALERLAATRANLTVKLGEVEDYLNWYQATQMTERSGQFQDYLRTADRLAEPPPTRADAISRYLDALELEYSEPPPP